MIYTAYFDEADTHGPAPTIIMAGYVGHAYQWRRFEIKLKRIQAAYGFDIFHAKDFRPSVNGVRSGQFSFWPEEKCNRLVADLRDLVTDTLTQGLVTSLSHEIYINEYRAPPVPKGMNLDSQYGMCFRVCLGGLLQLMQDRENKHIVDVVIEDGHSNVKDCGRIFEQVKQIWKRGGLDVLGAFTIKDKKSCMPLMVADILASVHSMMRAGVANGTFNADRYIIPPSAGTKAIRKKAIAVLELAPGALKDIKVANDG